MQGYKGKAFYSFIVFFVILGFVYIQKMQAFARTNPPRHELTLSYTLPQEYVSFGAASIPSKQLSLHYNNGKSIFYTGFSVPVLTNLSQARQTSGRVSIRLHAIVNITRDGAKYTNPRFTLRFLKYTYINECTDYLLKNLSIAINIPLNQNVPITVNNTNFNFSEIPNSGYPPQWGELTCFNMQFEPTVGKYGRYSGTITLTISEG